MRIRPLDGLRGIAACGVALYHIHPQGTFWMWSFVDLFFVLSGFLITSILLSLERFDLANFRGFWMRRILRIWPIYYLTMLGTLAVWIAFSLQKGHGVSVFSGFWESLVFMPYLLGSPEAGVNYLYFFGHSWSLAVEEQYYLIWPLLIAALSGRPAVLLAFNFSLLALCVLLRQHSELPEYLILTRADGIALGSCLAVWRLSPELYGSARVRGWLYLGLAALALWQLSDYFIAGYGGVVLGRRSYIVWFALLYATMVAALLEDRIPLLNRVLSTAPLVYLGSLSYAIYMFHLPIAEVLDKFHSAGMIGPKWVMEVAFWVLVIGLAAVSRILIEDRFEGLKRHFPLKLRPGLKEPAIVAASTNRSGTEPDRRRA